MENDAINLAVRQANTLKLWCLHIQSLLNLARTHGVRDLAPARFDELQASMDSLDECADCKLELAAKAVKEKEKRDGLLKWTEVEA